MIAMYLAIAASMLAVPVAFALLLMGGDPRMLGDGAATVVLVSLYTIMATPLLASRFGKTPSERLDRMLTIWMWASGITHLTWELSWCFANVWLDTHYGPLVAGGLTPEAVEAIYAQCQNDPVGWIWATYGAADGRYLNSDSFIVPMEWVTAVIGGPMTGYALWLTAKKHLRKAAAWILIVSVMELYGTVLYYTTEVFNDFQFVDTSSFYNLWVRFIGLNSIWVVFPSLSIYGCYRFLTRPQSPSSAS